MLLNKNILIIILQILILHKICITTEISSYIEIYNTEETTIRTVQKKLENFYIDEYSGINEKKDELICSMTDNEKQALCDLVFSMKHYIEMGFYISKTANYQAKLPCIKTQISFRYLNNSRVSRITRMMYPCYGRHAVVYTSFIEDDYYDFFYLSAGDLINSVAVYSQFNGKYYITNYIYNVILSQLQYRPVTIKQITQELKTMKKMFATSNYDEAEMIYVSDLYYQRISKNDPVCDLEYEKKITLCNIIFDTFRIEGLLDVELNKVAVYISNLSCKKQSVYKNVENVIVQLNAEQKMYPCPSKTFKNKLNALSVNKILADEDTNLYYISSSFKRNAVYLYVRTGKQSFAITDLIGNINLKNLKNIVITTDELIKESKSAYFRIQTLIDNIEKELEKQLSSILLTSKTDEQENEKIKEHFYQGIENLLKTDSESISKIPKFLTEQKQKTHESSIGATKHGKMEKFKFKTTAEQSNINKLLNVNEDAQKQKNISTFGTATAAKYNFQFGPQVYKRLLQKKRTELSSSTRKIGKKNKETTNSKKVTEKEVQRLIESMEIYHSEMVEKNLRKDNNKPLKSKSKKKRK